jgi:hypothetical protein
VVFEVHHKKDHNNKVQMKKRTKNKGRVDVHHKIRLQHQGLNPKKRRLGTTSRVRGLKFIKNNNNNINILI